MTNAANTPSPTAISTLEYRLQSPDLPLAVYREVAAHLRQITGVEVELLRQTATTFNYRQSQVLGLLIRHPDQPGYGEQVERILAYYGDRYQPWETIRP